MASFELRFKQSVAKDLRKLPNQDIKRILECIETLSKEPRPIGYEKLSNQCLYRVRFGGYRIIYEIKDEELIVVVIKVG